MKRFLPTLFFLIRFLGIYTVGTLLYQFYLQQYPNELDPLSWQVTDQIASLLNLYLTEVICQRYPGHLIADIFSDQTIVVRFIEGCNGVGVMILFLAFIVAFFQPIKHALWFIPSGLIFIHLANLLRVVVLGIVQYHIPKWSDVFHDYLFPLAIYGAVFLLWVVWIRYFVIPYGKE